MFPFVRTEYSQHFYHRISHLNFSRLPVRDFLNFFTNAPEPESKPKNLKTWPVTWREKKNFTLVMTRCFHFLHFCRSQLTWGDGGWRGMPGDDVGYRGMTWDAKWTLGWNRFVEWKQAQLCLCWLLGGREGTSPFSTGGTVLPSRCRQIQILVQMQIQTSTQSLCRLTACLLHHQWNSLLCSFSNSLMHNLLLFNSF